MPLRLGYLVPEFPGQTHIFFWREICALRLMGEEVVLLSTRKPSPMTCRHEFAAEALSETRYLFPPVVWNWAAWIGSGCAGQGQARDYLRGLEARRPKDRLRHWALFAAAVDLVQWARRERIDHIHAQSCADAAHVLALARRIGGPPYSLTLHGDLAIYGTDHAAKMAGAAFVSVVGDHLRQQVLEQTGTNGERVFVTCMGVEMSTLGTLGQDRNYRAGSLELVTVARLNPVKGHVHALAAVRLGLDAGLDLHYTIAGEGPHRDAVLAAIDRLSLNDHVTMTGTLSEAEVFALLSKADAFLLPSFGLGEAWPVSVMEAMGAGLPVIASIIGATPQMIASGEDGFLVPQRDEEALFQKIALLANDVALRQRIGAAARRTAERRFDVTVTAQALRRAVYESLGSGEPGSKAAE